MSHVALWDMASGARPTTYDFFAFLCSNHALGAKSISFTPPSAKRLRKWPQEEAMKRFHNYILPGPRLIGLPIDVAGIGEGDLGTTHLHLMPRNFKRLETVLAPVKYHFTVTIRQTFHNPDKNSDQAVWYEFAKKIGAHVIEDHAKVPIALYDRMSIYAGAEMNYGVNNGPMELIFLSPYPLTMVSDPATTMKGYSGHGVFETGKDRPWDFLLPNQRVSWGRPTVESLLADHERNGF